MEPWPVNHAGRARARCVAADPASRSVLCVGTFEPRKNHLLLLEAAGVLWRRGADFELVLIGRTTAQWGERVARPPSTRCSREGRAVRWLRHVDDDTLRQSLRRMRVHGFPVAGGGLRAAHP